MLVRVCTYSTNLADSQPNIRGNAHRCNSAYPVDPLCRGRQSPRWRLIRQMIATFTPATRRTLTPKHVDPTLSQCTRGSLSDKEGCRGHIALLVRMEAKNHTTASSLTAGIHLLALSVYLLKIRFRVWGCRGHLLSQLIERNLLA